MTRPAARAAPQATTTGIDGRASRTFIEQRPHVEKMFWSRRSRAGQRRSARARPTTARCLLIQSRRLQVHAIASKCPCAPKSAATGVQKLSGWLGSAGSGSSAPSQAAVARCRSSSPGMTFSPSVASTVVYPTMISRRPCSTPKDGVGRDFGSKNHPSRADFVVHLVFGPGELRSVQRRHIHHGDPDPTPLVDQFAANGLGKSLNRVFARAVGALQRNRSVPDQSRSMSATEEVVIQPTVVANASGVPKIRHSLDCPSDPRFL
jgi:hypothetical protein